MKVTEMRMWAVAIIYFAINYSRRNSKSLASKIYISIYIFIFHLKYVPFVIPITMCTLSSVMEVGYYRLRLYPFA
jgi:hypothetical protein